MKDSYRIDELAARWRVDSRTIYRLIKRGALSAFRVGVSWRVNREEVLRHEQRRIAAGEAQKV